MTLAEAKELAEQKDIGAILALAKFYYEDEDNRDYAEALKWYQWGAKCGDVQCMLLAANLGLTLAMVKNRISPDDINGQLKGLQEALHCAEEAVKNGENTAKTIIVDIKEQMGLVYYEASLYENTEEKKVFHLNEAMNVLKFAYEKSATPKSGLLLGITLYSLQHLLRSSEYKDTSFAYTLLYNAVQSGVEELPFLGTAYAFLGNMSVAGKGCAIDYDKAFYFYSEANRRGFECSDMLKRFKKKLFGGYTII